MSVAPDRYSEYTFLDVKVDEGIAVITFSRPTKLNALEHDDHRELSTILRDINADENVRVAVVTGAGRAFSVGGDLDLELLMTESPELQAQLRREANELVRSHIDCEKPVIAAVNGYSMGAATAFALLCDFIVMERQAKLADGHIRAALAAGDGGALIWPLAIGLTQAKKYLMTGDWITAEDADRLGLVSEVVEKGESLARALAIARRLADGPQDAIRFTKMALNQWLRVGQTAFDYSLALEMLSISSDDVPRALHNLKEKGVGAIRQED